MESKFIEVCIEKHHGRIVKVLVSVVTRMHYPEQHHPLLSAGQMGGKPFIVDSLVGDLVKS